MARAAWWGLDEEDATEALQTAILSGAKRVIVPNLGRDWVVKPIRLVPNLELVLEPGVVIPAKRGEYTGKTDSVFTAQDVVHFSLDSYGAVIRMQKLDYVVGKVSIEFGWARWFGHYERADRRMALALRGCENVRIYGVTLRVTAAATGSTWMAAAASLSAAMCTFAMSFVTTIAAKGSA